MLHDICIEKGHDNKIFLASEKGRMKYLHSVHPLSRPDLYTKQQITDEGTDTKNAIVIEEQKYVCSDNGYKYKHTVKYKYTSVFVDAGMHHDEKTKKTGRLFGLQENEENLLDVLHKIQENHLNEEDEVDNVLEHLQEERQVTLEEFLHSDKSPLLANILNELTNANAMEWEGKTIDELLPGLLNNGTALQNELTVKELNIICLEMWCATGCNWCSSNMVKVEIVNMIVKAFGSDTYINVEQNKKNFQC